MQQSNESTILLGLVLAVVLIIIGFFIYVICLRLVSRWLGDRDVSFAHSFLTCVLLILSNFGVVLVTVLLGVILIQPNKPQETTTIVPILQYCGVILQFLVESWIIQIRIDIPFGRACLVTFITNLFASFVIFICAIILFIILLWLKVNMLK